MLEKFIEYGSKAIITATMGAVVDYAKKSNFTGAVFYGLFFCQCCKKRKLLRERERLNNEINNTAWYQFWARREFLKEKNAQEQAIQEIEKNIETDLLYPIKPVFMYLKPKSL